MFAFSKYLIQAFLRNIIFHEFIHPSPAVPNIAQDVDADFYEHKYSVTKYFSLRGARNRVSSLTVSLNRLYRSFFGKKVRGNDVTVYATK